MSLTINWRLAEGTQLVSDCAVQSPGTTATISHIFLDSLLGQELVQENSSLALTLLCVGDTKE